MLFFEIIRHFINHIVLKMVFKPLGYLWRALFPSKIRRALGFGVRSLTTALFFFIGLGLIIVSVVSTVLAAVEGGDIATTLFGFVILVGAGAISLRVAWKIRPDTRWSRRSVPYSEFRPAYEVSPLDNMDDGGPITPL